MDEVDVENHACCMILFIFACLCWKMATTFRGIESLSKKSATPCNKLASRQMSASFAVAGVERLGEWLPTIRSQ